jgi:RimJ/RimL family protein N-acetyltransferase
VSRSTAHPSADAWPSASPSDSCDVLVLADATRLRIRPVEPGDRAGLAGLFARLSSTSRYRRYLSPKLELTPAELTYLTDLDHVTHEAIAAVDQSTGAIVGVARYAEQADRIGVADMAVEVADERHNMGIGTALVKVAIQRARANGLTLVTASVLWENRPARSLLRRLGFRALGSSGSVIEMQLGLEPDARPVVVGVQAQDRASD